MPCSAARSEVLDDRAEAAHADGVMCDIAQVITDSVPVVVCVPTRRLPH